MNIECREGGWLVDGGDAHIEFRRRDCIEPQRRTTKLKGARFKMSAVETYFGPDEPGETENKFDASSFLGFIRRSHPLWLDQSHAPDVQPWIYRGHMDADWPLIPSAARKVGKLAKIIDHLSATYAEHPDTRGLPEHVREAAAHLDAANYALSHFVQFGNRMEKFFERRDIVPNLAPSKIFSALPDIELQDCQSILGGNAMNYFAHWLTGLAQHHGIPTFLLDWTEDPWKAAFFAAEKCEDTDICLWALKSDVLFEHDPVRMTLNGSPLSRSIGASGLGTITSLRVDPRDNEYLSAQSGILTRLEWGGAKTFKGEFYPCLSEIVAEYTADRITASAQDQPTGDEESALRAIKEDLASSPVKLRKIVLANKHVIELRRLLLLERITKAHLMPTMDSLAETALSLAIDGLGN
jgi:FRG domain